MTARRSMFVVVISLLSLNFPATGNAQNDGFTNADMADWSAARKEAFVADAVLMLGHVVHLSDPETGNCILNWYYEDATGVTAEVLKGIDEFPDYAPTSIVIALARRQCGAIPPV